MRKAGIIALGGGILAAGVGVGLFMFVPKEKIELTNEGNKITWVDKSKSDVLGGKYYIYNDEFLVNKVTEQSYFVNREKLIDELGPDKVKKVNINYEDKSIHFTWEDTEDLGTDNSIWVSLYNEKDRQIAYSNAIKMNFASGVYKYVVEFNGEEFDVYDNSFTVDKEELQDGITYAKLYAIDQRGNKGAIASIPLYNYSVILSKENDNLRYHIDDVTQGYTYKAFIDDKDKGFVTSNEELNELLVDTLSPEQVELVDFNIVNKKANITWKDVEDRGVKYKVRIDAYGLSYYNKASSDDMTIEKNIGVKGYLYKINKNSTYKVTDKDKLTERGDIDFEGDYGTYYLHIASIDNEDNISKTKTFKFDIKDPFEKVEEEKPSVDDSTNDNKPSNPNNPNKPSDTDNSGGSTIKPGDGDNNEGNQSNKSELIKSMITTKGTVNTSSHKKAISILEKLPLDFINKMKSEGVSIYLTSGEAEDIYKSLTGTSISNITGAFVYGNGKPSIITEVAYMDSTLLHEAGHGIDYILGNGNFVSANSDFVSIYEEEKDKLFNNDEYSKSNSKEYFSEAFVMYYNKSYTLRVDAPKTYKYFKDILK